MNDDAVTTETGGTRSDGIAAHDTHDHIAAVFTDRAHAAAAVDDLRSLGLGSEHLGVAVAGDDTVAFEHDADREMLHDAEIGAAAGVPIGALAGIGLAGLVVPGLGVIGVGGMLAIAGASALWGGLLGAYFGTTAGEVAWLEHEDMGYTPLEGDEVLVVVCGHGHGDAVHDVMQRHDGRLRTIEAGKL